jgi:hypothetical protein
VPLGSILAPVLYVLKNGRYLYLHDTETWTSCFLQVASLPHCSEVMVWAMEHKG